MTTGFRINGVDWDDLYVRRDIFTEGGLWAWGENGVGQLGNGNVVHRSSPVQTVAGGSNWKQVSMGLNFSGAIKSDGTLWMWGDASYGKLGDNTSVAKSSPVQTISGGTNWKQISLGALHVGAVKTDGSLWLWGWNSYGQLGLGTNGLVTWKSSPVQTISGGTNWKTVNIGSGMSAAIKTDNTLWVWGLNTAGQLGDNTITHRSSPIQTVSGGTNWKSVSNAFASTAAIKTDGTLWVWGTNGNGQLGTNNTTSRSSPVQTVSGGNNWRQVSVGSNAMVAIKTDGTLWTWGSNVNGTLGDNTTTGRSSPVQTISSGTNWKQASGGGDGATAAIKTDGTLWVWGRNSYGQLGDGTRTNRSSPVQTIAQGNNWKQILVASGLNSARQGMIGIREDFF